MSTNVWLASLLMTAAIAGCSGQESSTRISTEHFQPPKLDIHAPLSVGRLLASAVSGPEASFCSKYKGLYWKPQGVNRELDRWGRIAKKLLNEMSQTDRRRTVVNLNSNIYNDNFVFHYKKPEVGYITFVIGDRLGRGAVVYLKQKADGTPDKVVCWNSAYPKTTENLTMLKVESALGLSEMPNDLR